MKTNVLRREMLRHLGVGALALSQPGWLAACANRVAEEAAMPLAFDPGRAWWMQHNFAPVLDEREVLGLHVEGSLPRELSGVYVRNGANPKRGDPGNYFVGDGMLHAVRLSGGHAEWYRNRWVRTPILDRDASTRVNPQLRNTDTPSNVSLVQHAGTLLSLGEIGLPFEMSLPQLATVGPYDYGGRLDTFMTAHPKLDPITRELHMFGYGFAAPFLTYHRVSPTGELTRSVPITLPRAVMIHDFAFTSKWIVFMDLPVVFDLKIALAGDPMPMRFRPEHGARLGLLPREGGDADVLWFEIEPCYVFHTVNAYDDASGNVVLEVCRMPTLWVNDSTQFESTPNLHRYTLDPVRKTVLREQLDDRNAEFPQLDARRAGLPHRYHYGLVLSDDLPGPAGNTILKYDRVRSASIAYDYGPARDAGETLFVPSATGVDEDAGYLLTFVFDRRTQRSSLDVFDAKDIGHGPIASVKLPFRVPFGFHGTWVADGGAT